MVDVVHESAYWDQRYANGGNSGAGSYGEAMLQKVDWLSRLTRIETIVEIGCGDFNFGRELTSRFRHAHYTGFDISRVIVERNRERYESHRIHFAVAGESIPPADLLLCVDVLFHVMDPDEQARLLARLAAAKWRYLGMSAYEYDGLKSRHVNIRRFHPTFFGRPILQETIEADGNMQFYIFERS